MAPPSRESGEGSPWSRLRRTRMLQFLGVYTGGSFAVLQVADIFMDRLGVPDWAFFGLVILILTGVPVVVLTAVVQDRERRGGRSLEPRDGDGRGTVEGWGRIFTWRNALLGGAGALVLLAGAAGLFMAARAMGIGPVGSLVAAGVVEREEAVLVADFQSPTGDHLLAGAITEAFRIDFEQTPLVRLVAPGQVRDGLLRMQQSPDTPLTPELARVLALREGIRIVLMGEVNSAGGGSILSVRLVDPDSEASLVSLRETVRDSTDVIPAVDRLSNRLRERLGESLRTIRGGESLEQATTASLPALRAYSQAVRAIDRERDFPRGVALLETAIAEDSTFAMAWRKLGVTLVNQGSQPERADAALTRAYELSDRLTERERHLARGSYYAAVARDPERAAAAYRALLELYPTDGTALNNLAGVYADRGDNRGAADLYRRALQIDPDGVVYHSNLVGQLVQLGEWEEAEARRADFEARFPGLIQPKWLRVLMLHTRGDHAGAEAEALALLDHPAAIGPDRFTIVGGLVGLAVLRGRVAEARGRTPELQDAMRAAGYPLNELTRRQLDLQVQLALEGDTAGAVDGMRALLASDPIPDAAALQGAQLQVARFFLAAGRPSEAREAIDAWEDAIGEEVPAIWVEGVHLEVQAGLLMAQGRYDEAVRTLEGWTRQVKAPSSSLFSLAAIHREQGEGEVARELLRRFVGKPELYRLDSDAWLLPQAHLWLAELSDSSGDTREAATHYLRFAELWEEADPFLQPRVEAARARARELQGSSDGG